MVGPGAVRQAIHGVLEAGRMPGGQLRLDNVFCHVRPVKP